jgi:hypothetical protein
MARSSTIYEPAILRVVLPKSAAMKFLARDGDRPYALACGRIRPSNVDRLPLRKIKTCTALWTLVTHNPLHLQSPRLHFG